jgi:hypothetical protein
MVTKTGWCRFNSFKTSCGFEYCVEIPFWKNLKFHGASSGNENSILAITDTNLIEINRIPPAEIT